MAEKGKSKNIAGRVREAIESLIEEAGYILWDVTYYKEVAEMTLEVSIDKEGGIGTDDCEAVSHIVNPILDEMDPIEESYSLLVSSAGSIRDLRLPMHFEYALANQFPVTVKTFVAVDGKKQFEGVLLAYGEDSVTLQTESGNLTFDSKQIGRITAFCEKAADTTTDK